MSKGISCKTRFKKKKGKRFEDLEDEKLPPKPNRPVDIYLPSSTWLGYQCESSLSNDEQIRNAVSFYPVSIFRNLVEVAQNPKRLA